MDNANKSLIKIVFIWKFLFHFLEFMAISLIFFGKISIKNQQVTEEYLVSRFLQLEIILLNPFKNLSDLYSLA